MFPLHGEELHSSLQGLVDLCPGFDTRVIAISRQLLFFFFFPSDCFVSSSFKREQPSEAAGELNCMH